MNSSLNDYLSYLDEQLTELNVNSIIKLGKAGLSHVGSGVRTGGFWSLIIIPGVFAAWRGSNALISDAVRKCGTFKKGAGRDACVSREKIKGFQQQLNILNSSKGRCSTAPNPEICLQKLEIEVNKIKNRLDREKDKLKSGLGFTESVVVEQGFIAATTGMIIGGLLIDKATFLAFRAAKAMYSTASRRCGAFAQGAQRDACMSKYKLTSLLQQKTLLEKMASKCNNKKDKQVLECKEKFSKKIEDIDRQIRAEKDTITAGANEERLKKQEEEFKRAQREQV